MAKKTTKENNSTISLMRISLAQVEYISNNNKDCRGIYYYYDKEDNIYRVVDNRKGKMKIKEFEDIEKIKSEKF